MTESVTEPDRTMGATDPVLARFLLRGLIQRFVREDGRGYHAQCTEAGVSHRTWKRWVALDVIPGVPQIRAIIKVCGYDEDHDLSRQLLRLAQDARRHNVVSQAEWLSSTAFDLYVAIERVSQLIKTYEFTLIPGLLQTKEYARAYFLQAGLSGNELEQRVDLRMQRQAILTRKDGPARLVAIVDEGALHREPPGDGVMHGQLAQLLELGTLDTIELRVIPFASGLYSTNGDGSFVLLTSKEVGLDIAYVEGGPSANYFETPEALQRYNAAFERLARWSLGPEASADLIRRRLSST
ncbi:DUF5753 domain-containing protein [Cryptosporangium sp. NPDC048952]|uniref:DUF5753 domain-containing protein n=1 Tax=Cryptosporangium sp. NPDC048952 TaxID=3363961 RepID=UPI0037112685